MKPGNAGRTLDAGCDEFLARHSEYMDGQLPPVLAGRLGSHAAACPSCARYDRVVRRGVALVRELPDIAPADEFELRLQHRLFHVQDADALGGSRASGAAAALAIAAAIALLAWSPLLVQRTTAPGMPATAAASPRASVPIAQPSVPLFDQSAWYPVPLAVTPAEHPSALLAAFPGPYSPLVVTPPVHRTMRSISTGYAPID